jgi:hypothetical protein
LTHEDVRLTREELARAFGRKHSEVGTKLMDDLTKDSGIRRADAAAFLGLQEYESGS